MPAQPTTDSTTPPQDQGGAGPTERTLAVARHLRDNGSNENLPATWPERWPEAFAGITNRDGTIAVDTMSGLLTMIHGVNDSARAELATAPDFAEFLMLQPPLGGPRADQVADIPSPTLREQCRQLAHAITIVFELDEGRGVDGWDATKVGEVTNAARSAFRRRKEGPDLAEPPAPGYETRGVLSQA